MPLNMEDIKKAKEYGYEIFGSNKVTNTYQPNYSFMEKNEITDFSDYDALDLIGSNEADSWNPIFHFSAKVDNYHFEKDGISKESLENYVVEFNNLNDLNVQSKEIDWDKVISKIQLPDFDDTGLAIINLKDYLQDLSKENDSHLEDSLGGNAYFDNLNKVIFDDEQFNTFGWLQIMPYALLIHDNEMCELVPLIKEEFEDLNSVSWTTLDDETAIHEWLTQMEKIVPDISDVRTCMDIDISDVVPVVENSNSMIVKHN